MIYPVVVIIALICIYAPLWQNYYYSIVLCFLPCECGAGRGRLEIVGLDFLVRCSKCRKKTKVTEKPHEAVELWKEKNYDQGI